MSDEQSRDQPNAGDPKGSNAGETPLEVAAQHIVNLLRADGAKASVMQGALILLPFIKGQPADKVGSSLAQMLAMVVERLPRALGFVARTWLKLASKVKVEAGPEPFVKAMRNATDTYVNAGLDTLKADLKRDIDEWIVSHVEEICVGIEAVWLKVLTDHWPGDK
jgi:hypothetical protein